MFPVKLYCKEVIDKFFSRFIISKNRMRNLIIVSPWITYSDFKVGTFNDVIRKIKKDDIPTYVITRSPSYESHQKAIDEFLNIKKVEINLYNDLHAKIFIADCDDEPFALVGSANFTQNSFKNFELGVLINGRNEGVNLINQLTDFALIELRTINSIKILKKMEVKKCMK